MVGAGLPVTLNPQQAMTLQVQFNPTTPGAATGQIAISSNSTSGGTSMVALSGTGTSASAPQTSPQLAVSSTSLSFGSVTVNTGATQSLTLTSTGTAPVTVSSAAISGAGFTIVAQTFPVTLNPTQSVTIQIQFRPTAAGAASGQITINSNSTTGGTALVALGGTGTTGNPQLTIGGASVNFGSVAVNTPTTQTLTLSSSGTTAVTVNSAAITGAGFAIVGGSFPVTLNPGQTLTLQLQFTPTTAGALSGQIMISSNSVSGNTAVVTLSGTGTAVAHEVDLSWDAPVSSPDPVAGYNIYRATGGGSLVLINASPNVAVVYVDSTVASGTNYSYLVKSVDSSGVESVPSNQITVTIP
jgi:Abnormal spindle-like microcephaly-assoc'd, ASPM-SPD-2-Hydin